MSKIKQILAREILNSKGMPTIEATVVLENGRLGRASSPTGTSVSGYEAKEVRDNDPKRYSGQGVLTAISNISETIAPKIIGMEVQNQKEIDKTMIELDGTKDKSKLGSNAILPVSMAVAKAAATDLNIPLFAYIRNYATSQSRDSYKIPIPAFNIINGGKHAGNNLDFQEFLIIPASSMPYSQTLNLAVSIYQSLKKTLTQKGAITLVGDEGGFGPSFSTNRDALVMLAESIAGSGLRINYDVFLGLDASANNFYQDGKYVIKDKQNGANSNELISIYESLNEEYNFLYLEDPLAEDDWDGWEDINKITSENTLIVGDDLTATNIDRLVEAVSKKTIGGVIIKPNQAGTITETIAVTEAVRLAGLKVIVSHRSGETNDDFIADFGVGVGADYVKFGAPARGERTIKYNRLLEIESMIKNSSG